MKSRKTAHKLAELSKRFIGPSGSWWCYWAALLAIIAMAVSVTPWFQWTMLVLAVVNFIIFLLSIPKEGEDGYYD